MNCYKLEAITAYESYPFGSLMPGRSFSSDSYRYGWNKGSEKDDEITGVTGSHITTLYREYDNRLGRTWSMDPVMQPHQSPYNSMDNNPIMFNDVLGNEVDVTHRKGFLGLGKKETLKYESGSLFNKDGSAYTGKIKGFLKQSVDALEKIDQTQEGSSMITELQNSKNVFNIVKGNKNEFVENDKNKAFANQFSNDPDAAGQYADKIAKGIDFTGGSGGTIFFNPYNAYIAEVGGGFNNRAAVSLGHEMFHGLDANKGLLDSRPHLGVLRSEWQASYRENIMRVQMGLPLRTHYKSSFDLNTRKTAPSGPSLLDSSNSPILPSWYKH